MKQAFDATVTMMVIAVGAVAACGFLAAPSVPVQLCSHHHIEAAYADLREDSRDDPLGPLAHPGDGQGPGRGGRGRW